VIFRSAQILKKSSDYFRNNLGAKKQGLAYVGGWLGKKNIGDEALFDAVKNLFSEFSLWHFDGSRTIATLLDRFPLTSNGLFAGGTLINRCAEHFQVADRFLRAGRKLYIFGTGVADPDFWEGRADFQSTMNDWKELLNRCGYVGVRGPRSAELLADAGVRNVEVVGDPVIAFADEEPALEIEPNSIGFNIGYNHGNQWGDERLLPEEFLALAKLAKQANWSIKWFVVFPRDLEITEQLALATGTQDNIVCIYQDAKAYMKEVRSMSTFIGMKLHATMLATCTHVPSVMLEYDPKCLDFMKSIGQGASVIRTDRFAAVRAWDLLQGMNAGRRSHSQAIHKGIHSLQQFQLSKSRAVAELLNSNSKTNNTSAPKKGL
jgi:polysaccharide pyruvyl transferase WcaK-like protein